MIILLIIALVICGVYCFSLSEERNKLVNKVLDFENEIKSWSFTVDNKEEKYINIEEQLRKEKISHNLTREALKKEVEGNKLLEVLNKEYENDIRDKKQIIENIQKLGCIGQQIKVLPDNTVELIANVSKDGTIFDIKGEQPKTVKRQYNKKKN